LLLDPRFAGSNPAEDDGFLRAIRIHSKPYFRGEVKPSAPCLKILLSQLVKEPLRYERDTSLGKIHHFLHVHGVRLCV
jgi:hypothetical protein